MLIENSSSCSSIFMSGVTPISEIEWLLKEKYKTEKNLLKDYDDIIKENK